MLRILIIYVIASYIKKRLKYWYYIQKNLS